MGREKRLSTIFAQFDKSAKEFCEETQGFYCEISSQYKGEEKPQNLKYRFAKIYYKSFAVKFIYTAHGIMSTVNSILGCSVYLDKNEDSTEIPLPLLTDYCDMDVAAPMCIPLITNAEGMIQAFDSIGSVLKKMLAVFDDISYSPERKEAVLKAFADEMKFIFEIGEASEMPVNAVFFYDFFTLRFSGDAFINSLKGNKSKAVKQLSKIKKQTGYEKRMAALWMSGEQNESPDLSAIIINADFYNENGVQKTNLREFGAVFFSWVLLLPAFAAVYLGLYFLLVWLEGRNSVYLMGPVYNFPYCIMFGFITSIAVSYFTRFRIYKLLYKKNYEKYCEMDYIQNGGGADRLMKGFLAVIVAVSVVGCAFLAKWNLNFLTNGFMDNSKFLSLQGEYYPYSDVERVYYKPDRVNGFNETLDFPSYVVVLKSGEEIDLYEHGDISDYEDKLLNYLREKGVRIEDSNT